MLRQWKVNPRLRILYFFVKASEELEENTFNRLAKTGDLFQDCVSGINHWNKHGVKTKVSLKMPWTHNSNGNGSYVNIAFQN